MADLREISVALSSEAVATTEEAIEAGEYASASEVVRDALPDWRERRALVSPSPEELRQLWREGLESGEPVEAGPVFEHLLDKFRNVASSGR